MNTKCIDKIEELDLTRLKAEDLKWHFGTGRSQTKGSGRDKTSTYRTGVQTPIGDIEISVWMEAAEFLVEKNGLQEEAEHLTPFMRFYRMKGGPHAKRDLRAETLDACLSGLYRNPKWVCYGEYNQKYHPELLDTKKEEINTEMKDQAFTMRPASPDEAGLFYSEEAMDEVLGTVGHLRMDFGHKGKEFWHTWWPHNGDTLNTPEFKAELQQVVDQLRASGPLKDLRAMEDQCAQYPEAKISDGVCGFIIETENYRFCLRCTPRPGDYQGYLYAYDLRQQEQAQAMQPPDQGMTMGGIS